MRDRQGVVSVVCVAAVAAVVAGVATTQSEAAQQASAPAVIVPHESWPCGMPGGSVCMSW